MPISPEAIERFRARRFESVGHFKNADPDWLLETIYKSTGAHYEYIGFEPRPAQLEGLALSLYLRRCLLRYGMRVGKALRWDWPVATPQGWKPIWTLRTGDAVYGPDGALAAVTGVFPQGLRKMFRVTFSDGAKTICDGEHIWSVMTAKRKYLGAVPLLLTTNQMIAKGLDLAVGSRFFIPLTSAVPYPEKRLPIDPYLLGIILGDGCTSGSNFSLTTDLEIVQKLALPAGMIARVEATSSPGVVTAHLRAKIRGAGNPLKEALRSLGILGKLSADKFVPAIYLTSSLEQRRALLAGLLDTDGWVQNSGKMIYFASSSKRLALAIQTLVRSLGGISGIKKRVTRYTYLGEKKQGQLSYTVLIKLPLALGCPFHLSRKKEAWRPSDKFQAVRAIRSIEPAGEAEAVCISVDRPDGLFIIKDYVVTHNTKLGLDWARMLRQAGLWKGKGIVIAHAPKGVTVWQKEAATQTDQQVDGMVSGVDSAAKLLALLKKPSTDLVVIAWSTLQQMFSVTRASRRGKGPPKAYADLKAIRKIAPYFSLCIIDEIHKVANHQSLRFNIAEELLSHCDYRLGFTGTLTGRHPQKVWAQMFLIDEGDLLGRSFAFFEAAMAKDKTEKQLAREKFMPRWARKPVFDKANIPLLRDWLNSVSISYKLEEVQAVNVKEGIIKLSMSPEQMAAYEEELAKAREVPEDDKLARKNVFMRLRQISAGFVPFIDDDGKRQIHHFWDAAKIVWLNEFLADYDKRSFQVIIFHEFIPTGNKICQLLKKHGILHGRVGGGAKGDASEDAISDFQAGEIDFIVMNSAAGAEALDLPQADYQLFFDCPVSAITRSQAAARALNRGDRELWVDDLVCSPSDQRILGFVKQGKSVLAELQKSSEALSNLFGRKRQR